MKWKKVSALAVCIAEVLVLAGGAAACAGKDNGSAPPQEVQPNAVVQPNVEVQPTELPKETKQNGETPDTNGATQISLEDAKAAALSDAGVSGTDVHYTKEKHDHEHGISIYEIEFYAGDAAYEYEIDAVTGAVYSKEMNVHHEDRRHAAHNNAVQADIGADAAKTIALEHAGFSEADIAFFKSEYDYEDGQAVYEVEFTKDGKEYEYTISAAEGTIIAYEAD